MLIASGVAKKKGFASGILKKASIKAFLRKKNQTHEGDRRFFDLKILLSQRNNLSKYPRSSHFSSRPGSLDDERALGIAAGIKGQDVVGST